MGLIAGQNIVVKRKIPTTDFLVIETSPLILQPVTTQTELSQLHMHHTALLQTLTAVVLLHVWFMQTGYESTYLQS
jgi:hypothetical protein